MGNQNLLPPCKGGGAFLCNFEDSDFSPPSFFTIRGEGTRIFYRPARGGDFLQYRPRTRIFFTTIVFCHPWGGRFCDTSL